MLRAGLLYSRGRSAEGLRQLALLPKNAETSLMIAHAELTKGRALAAFDTPGLDAGSRTHLIRARLTDAELERELGKTQDLDPTIRIELAARYFTQGKAEDAVKVLPPGDRERRRLYTEAGRMRSAGDHLGLARFLVANAGSMSHGIDTGEARGAGFYYAPGTADGRAMEGAMTRGDERWLALGELVTWLEKNRGRPDARDVLAEADALYNRLLNYGGGDRYFWGRFLPTSDLRARLRKVGAEIRSSAAPRRPP
jgi:hypothetical protein